MDASERGTDDLIIDDASRAAALLAAGRRIAVLGMKPESMPYEPAHYVPRYLQRAGYTIVPVPVYFPEIEVMLGEPVYRTVAEVPAPIDVVLVFRKPEDVAPHVDDLIAARPAAVWMQSGIRHADAARRLAQAGIRVVQDRCAMIDHRRIEARQRRGA